MEISKFNQVSPVTTAKTAAAETSAKAESGSAAVTETDTAKISQDFEILSQARRALSTISEVNSQRVAEVRQSVTEGSFNLDLERVAEAMFRQHGTEHD